MTWRRPTPAGYRFAVGPLLVAAHVDDQVSLAHRIGVTPRQVRRAIDEGLSADTADRWAIAAGVHPSQVWNEWWAVIPLEADA